MGAGATAPSSRALLPVARRARGCGGRAADPGGNNQPRRRHRGTGSGGAALGTALVADAAERHAGLGASVGAQRLHVVDTQLVVSLRQFRMTLFRAGRRSCASRSGSARRARRRPADVLHPRPTARYASPFYGPIAFGTSARSAVLTDWPAGGFIGIHGTNAPPHSRTDVPRLHTDPQRRPHTAEQPAHDRLARDRARLSLTPRPRRSRSRART